MIEIFCQLKDGKLIPASREYADELKAYQHNQIVRCKITGTKKARSVRQHRYAMWMIRFVSESDDDLDWSSFEGAKRQIKMIMRFFKGKPHVDLKTGVVWFELASFAFTEMPQMEADRIYNDVKLICAQRLGCDPADLEADAKRNA